LSSSTSPLTTNSSSANMKVRINQLVRLRQMSSKNDTIWELEDVTLGFSANVLK
jgi:hypothetical protein